MSFDPSEIWPRGSTDLLLRTALHVDPDAARAAWSEWSAAYDLDSAPWMDVRIAALVGARLPALGIETDQDRILKGVTRHIWAHGQSRFAASRPLLAAWHEAGIPMMATKGFARIVAEPALAARRYIGDIDILIHRDHWDRAVDTAWAAGWTTKNGWSADDLKTRMRHRRHSVSLTADTPVELDLHMFALIDNRCGGDDDGVWARAVAGRYAEMPFLVPSPPDRAVMACGHGSVFDEPSSAQVDWLVDAAAAFATPEMDWAVFETEITRRVLCPQALGALAYLETLGRPAPAELIERLRADCPEPVVACLRAQRQDRAARQTRRYRANALAADILRAERACAARPELASAGGGPAEGRATPEDDGLLYRVPVPAGIRAGDTAEVELVIEPGRLRPGERIVIEAQYFEWKPLPFAEWRAPLKGRLARLLGARRWRLPVSATLLAAREAVDLRLELRRPRRRGATPETAPVAGIAYRWRVTPGG